MIDRARLAGCGCSILLQRGSCNVQPATERFAAQRAWCCDGAASSVDGWTDGRMDGPATKGHVSFKIILTVTRLLPLRRETPTRISKHLHPHPGSTLPPLSQAFTDREGKSGGVFCRRMDETLTLLTGEARAKKKKEVMKKKKKKKKRNPCSCHLFHPISGSLQHNDLGEEMVITVNTEELWSWE